MIGKGTQQVLVFTRTKHGANHLAQQLNKDGILVRRFTEQIARCAYPCVG
ncbi:hypothetical protein ACNKHP_23000 [Shigella boydii]